MQQCLQLICLKFNNRMSNYLNVYTVELYAMLMALEWNEQISCSNVLIFIFVCPIKHEDRVSIRICCVKYYSLTSD